MNRERSLGLALQAVSTELAGWADVVGRLEDVLGQSRAGRSATTAEIGAVQQLDMLGQNLRQLAQFLGEVGSRNGDASSVRAAADRLNLEELKARLTGGEVVDVKTGEPELW